MFVTEVERRLLGALRSHHKRCRGGSEDGKRLSSLDKICSRNPLREGRGKTAERRALTVSTDRCHHSRRGYVVRAKLTSIWHTLMTDTSGRGFTNEQDIAVQRACSSYDSILAI